MSDIDSSSRKIIPEIDIDLETEPYFKEILECIDNFDVQQGREQIKKLLELVMKGFTHKAREVLLKTKIIKLVRELDIVGDAFEEDQNMSFDDALQKMLILLTQGLGIKGAAISYDAQLLEGVEFDEHEFPVGELKSSIILQTKGLKEQSVSYALDALKSRSSEKGEEELTRVVIGVDDENEVHYMIPLVIGEKFGALDLVLDEDVGVTDDLQKVVVEIERYLDTFVNRGRKKLIKDKLTTLLGNISRQKQVEEFPEVYRQYCALLSKMTGQKICLIYKDEVEEHGGKAFMVSSDEIHELNFEPDFFESHRIELLSKAGIKFEKDSKLHLRNLMDDSRGLFEEKVDNNQRIGLLIAIGDNGMNQEHQELLEVLGERLNDDILLRKSQTEAYVMGFGHTYAYLRMRGELDIEELRKEKPIFLAMCDVEGYTSWVETIQPEALGRIMDEYFHECEMLALHVGAFVDKFVGDEVIYAIPAKDASLAAAISIYLCKETQKLWKKVLEKEKTVSSYPKVACAVHYAEKALHGHFGRRRRDWTNMGSEINEAARTEGEAKGGQIYATKSAVESLIEIDPDEKAWGDYMQLGLSRVLRGKGVHLPIQYGEIISVDEYEANRHDQKSFFDRYEDVIRPFTLEETQNLPNGDYNLVATSSSEGEFLLMILEFDGKKLEVLIKKDDITPETYPVPIDVYKLLLQSDNEKGYSEGNLLRVKDGAFKMISHDCIEHLVRNTLKQLLEHNERTGLGILIKDLNAIPSGEYKILGSPEKKDDHYIYLVSRMGVTIEIPVPFDKFEGEIFNEGVLVYVQRTFKCKGGDPEWKGLV